MAAEPVWSDMLKVKGACPVAHTVDILGGKWTLLVIRELLGGPRRFGEILARIGDVNPKTLTDRLRVLQEHDIVSRTAYPEVPPRVEYALTPRGRSLEPILAALWRWGVDDLLGHHPATAQR